MKYLWAQKIIISENLQRESKTFRHICLNGKMITFYNKHLYEKNVSYVRVICYLQKPQNFLHLTNICMPHESLNIATVLQFRSKHKFKAT